ncbi:MAG: tetratricopeptide repeat protein [Tepidisphaeraceae bacterium]|jgi:protein O-GlcNAc transferase
MSVEQKLQTGFGHHQAGRTRDAEAVYRQILAEQPNHPDALHLLGIIENQSGRPQNAVELIRRAIAVNPNHADFHQSLGLILARMGRQDEAVAAHHRAVQLNPQHRQAHYDLANLLLLRGQVEQAIAEYRNAIAINPQFAQAHQNLGCALHRAGRLDAAETHLRRALEIQPKMADAHNNLGGVLAARVRLPEAVAQYRQALSLRPDFAAAMSNLGSALRLLGQRAEAIQVLRRAIQLAPDLPEAFNNLGIALKDDGQLDEAVATYRKCLAIRPSMADATNNLGNAYKDCGNVRDTVACYGRALALGPSEPGIHSNLVYTLQFHPGYDDESLFREQRRWNEIHATPLKASIRPHDNDRSPDRKLRVGYVSAYFYSQAESFFVAPLLENHDRQQFEIHCYASVVRPDQFTRRLKSAADSWHDVLGSRDADLAEQIRRDRIDVLIDLAMHMAHNRMLVFARKPAPVQIAWLAYPGGTGLDAMDYRITDAFMDPLESPAAYYREQSWRLPDCWCCYDPMCDLPPAPPRTDGPIRFGSINNPCKNNDAILALWARILSGVPDSRLLMQSFSEMDKNRIRSILHRGGVAPERIEFVPRTQRNDYLRLYDSIDIGLDPLPYNGITTTCDALWMGVPVVTLTGQTAAGRAGVSILSTVGLTELIARTQEQYVQIVTQLAGDPPRLAQLRSTLRQRMTQSPMMDGPGFARKMESAYRQMWQRWCNSPLQAS